MGCCVSTKGKSGAVDVMQPERKKEEKVVPVPPAPVPEEKKKDTAETASLMLLTPTKLGDFTAKNRLALAPLTRRGQRPHGRDGGFDMIEVHSANGYLLDEFLQSVTNKRTDEYGGSVENRLRMLREVLDAVESVFPLRNVGVRLSPNGAFGAMGSEDNVETFSAAIKLLGERGVGYVHLMDGLGFGFHEKTEPFTLAMARDILKGTKAEETVLMGNVGYTKETAEARLQAGEADMIAFGRPYISNPDLAVRFAKNAPLNEDAPYEAWWSSHGAKMYTDYPAMQA
eukprot:TRINITY_DN6974_c0_g1_i3.p1 TRINITY_DN6974_c0_g1~~TRINITY_DN6974_c0_g1_i3.p1  ORF type:complete len:285 (+),score=116.63 TRINITY_DN6974_c0_g1_i3:59-913(+)